MKRITWQGLEKMERILWALVLICLPVTSFRYLPFMGAGSQVRPLSLIPAAVLLLLLLVRSVREKRFLLWDDSLIPLLVFVLVALASSAAGFLLAPLELYGISYENRLVRAWVTLAVGLVFYLVAIRMNRNEQTLAFTLKWLYIGLVAHVVWSLVQLLGFYVLQEYLNPPLNDIVDTIQKTVMVAGVAPNERISGLALEPSWLAAQVAALYLPWAFAALLKNHTWDRRRWLVPVILLASIFLIIFTYSRSGILTAAAVAGITFLLTGGDLFRRAWRWLMDPFRMPAAGANRRFAAIGTRLVIFFAFAGGLAAGGYILSSNEYFATIWQSLATTSDPVDYFTTIYAGPRFAYAAAGWKVFQQHPFTGVGLGALGLYLHNALPDWAHFNIPEIARLLSSDNTVYPNAKNLFIRLLAETGIAGLWTFLGFYFFVLGRMLNLLRSARKEIAFVGVAGLFSWLAVTVLGLSLDSFAMPMIWIPLGIVMGLSASRA